MKCIVNGLMTEYTQRGSGPVVVLLHGWGTDASNMQQIAQGLGDQYTVVAVDLPGFGRSEQPHEAWGVGDYALYVNNLLKKLNIEQVYTLVGHSFGGRICIKAVSERIISPDKIVLIGSAGVKHSDNLRNSSYRLIAKSGKALLSLPGLSRFSQAARKRLYAQAGASDDLQAGGMKDIFQATINEDLSQNASNITIPALLIWGGNDDQAPIEDARFLKTAMPNASLKVIEAASHFVHNEYPDKVNRWIKDFLDDK